MAAFMNRLFSNLFSFLPWHVNSTKRYREDLGEDEENHGATPPKKQRLYKGPFATNVLREVNIQPNLTTVRPAPNKLQIREDCFQPRLFDPSKCSMPWSENLHLGNGERAKHVFSPPKSRRQRVAANIDLTKEDDDRNEHETSRVPVIDLTRPSDRPIQMARRSLQVNSTRSTPDSCSLLGSTNSSSSEEYLSEDEESSDESLLEINTKRVQPTGSSFRMPKHLVDLTDQDSRSPTPEKSTTLSNSTDNEMRRRRNGHVKSPLARDRQYALRNFNRSSREMSAGSKPVVSIDLTEPNNGSLRRKKSISSSMSQDVSVIDLKECISYGRVLGSVLQAQPASPPKPSTPINDVPIDLTGDDEDINNLSKEASISKKKENFMKKPIIEKSVEPAADISTSTKKELNNEVAKVNSFYEKIKDIPCTQEDWLQKLLKGYKDSQEEFNSTRDCFVREAREWSKVNYKDVEALLEEKIKRHLRLTDALIPEAPAEPYPAIVLPLPEFTPEMDAKVKAALVRFPESEVLIKKFNLSITRKDIQTLNHLNWLNDEVINFYMQLLEERCKEQENYPSIHTFNTFFYTGLKTRGHDGMKRWTKKVNIFEKDIIIVPIHLHVHWCLVVMDLKKKEINYYDSMGNDNNDCLRHMSKYLMAEHKVKIGEDLDLSDWKIQNVKDIPQQMNGSDCGIFACTYGEYSARRAPFSFDQSKMQYFRKKMTYEIISGQLIQ